MLFLNAQSANVQLDVNSAVMSWRWQRQLYNSRGVLKGKGRGHKRKCVSVCVCVGVCVGSLETQGLPE